MVQNKNDLFKTAADVAYDIIKDKILSGELKPGMKLSKRKMARLAGVSVIPVIEALNRLEADWLVESKPQWGSFVTVPSIHKVKEMYALREAIECQSARILSKNLTLDKEAKLRELAARLDEIRYSEDTYKEFEKRHYEFHMAITELTGYASLVDTLRRANLFSLLCKAVSTRRKHSDVPENFHMAVVDAIASGDENLAEAKMRGHINDSFSAIMKEMEQDNALEE